LRASAVQVLIGRVVHSQQCSRHNAHTQLQPDRTALATAGG
jgi:hypothetical protein